MGMPSYLKGRYMKKGWANGNSDEPSDIPFGVIFGMGVVAGKSQYIHECIPKNIQDKRKDHVGNCLLRYALKHHFFGIYEGERGDLFKTIVLKTAKEAEDYRYEKVPVMVFQYHEKEDGKWKPYGFKYLCNRYFAEKVEALSEKRMEADMERLLKKEDLDRIRNVEQGRMFKGRLRQIIMERDGYKCVLCGKAAADGITLEVDHVKAWEDGGKTIFDNGRTVCSECNKGLHWAKKYNEKKADVAASA